MKISKKLYKSFILLYFVIGNLLTTQAQFVEITSNVRSVNQSTACWGDYNNDGRLDLLIMGWDENTKERIAHIYKNTENQGFIDINAPIKGINNLIPRNLAWGDFDNDDNLDIIIAGQDGFERVAHIYRNQGGTGIFKEVKSDIVGVYSSSVAWGDYDNNGRIDVVVSGMSVDNVPTTKVYRNDKEGFTEAPVNLEAIYDGACAWGDYNNDGKLDLVVTGRNAQKQYISKVYRNEGNNVFTDINVNILGVNRSAVAWGDYDNDGQLDLVILGVGNDGNNVTKLYHNNGNGFSENTKANFVPLNRGDVAWGDYNNDGRLDLIFMGMNDDAVPTTKIYENAGDGSFFDIEAPIVQLAVGSCAWGDYDNDGKLDLVITGQDANFGVVTKIYQNTTARTNLPPKAPTNLRARVSGNTVTLAWDKAEDAGDPNSLTPQNELTYNIHLGLVSQGVEMFSPMADTQTGFRKVVALGNVNHLNTWTIEGLPAGQYHWSVQAIDNGFAGSPFAQEGTFVIE